MSKNKILVGATLLGLAGCSVDTQVSEGINSKLVPKRVSPYQVIQHDDDKSYGYHVIEVKGGGKTYLMIRHDGYDGRECMIKLDEKYDGETYGVYLP